GDPALRPQRRGRPDRPPVLIQGAEDDLIVPAFLQREQARAFPGAQVHMFRTGGHFFPVTRIEEFVEVLERFADRAG
ncbi:MAG TPA: alpha/beta hydrolase, partial [Beijerinckiaceae bacterium]|nr:alpha/beta hydrolase [Beijerinckiaceae bacterium]